MDLTNAPLNTRIRSCLNGYGLETREQAEGWFLDHLASYGDIPNFGRVSFIEMGQWLDFDMGCVEWKQHGTSEKAARFIYWHAKTGRLRPDDALTRIGDVMGWP